MSEMDRIPLTPEGYDRLTEELKRFKEERPRVIQAIGEARAHGDLSENAEYHAARERQGIVEAHIRKLEDILSRAQVIDYRQTRDPRVRFGARVTLYDQDRDETTEYQLVGDPEADIRERRISILAPLGRALLGKEAGDEVVFQAPGGTRRYEVMEVRYGDE